MNKIPLKSQFSLLKGFWFIFQDGDRSIAAHGSATGQEKIFVNGQLISKKRSLRMTSKHQFSWEGNTYELVFRISQILNWKMECSLAKDGVLIGCFKTSCKSKFTIVKILVVYTLVGAVIGFIFGYFNLPLWLLVILCACVIADMTVRGKNNIVINQEV